MAGHLGIIILANITIYLTSIVYASTIEKIYNFRDKLNSKILMLGTALLVLSNMYEYH